MNSTMALAAPLLTALTLNAAEISPLPDKMPTAILDRQDFQVPDRVQLTGWIGGRVQANEANRLAKLDAARLLEGYRHRPGRQSWDGEHVGKWLHAATLAWVNTGDPVLREKLDYIVAELAKCQMPDGYLGTYDEEKRWKSWDVWAHKYNLIGLITYMRYTGNTAPLPTCRRMADLLCITFGDEPGKRDIIKTSPHVGMASTSVLEPMVLLYRLTGEPRYLEFCKYLLRAWESPKGPKIISTLLAVKRVDKVANGKAYEMLSCLNGALELYRTTGDTQLLQACLIAWQDIVERRLYITGGASYFEIFHDDYDLPNVNNVGETCVTVTWMQFNAQLLRLTGEARFADQLEHVVLNQLFGAQRCDGAAWGYYVQMEGQKPYSTNLDGHCCLSSGPRGVALIPSFALTTDADGIVVNLYDAGSARLKLRDRTAVMVATETQYPGNERIRIAIEPMESKSFTVKLRVPAWCRSATAEVNGQKVSARAQADGYVTIKREWKKGDRIALRLKLEPRLVVGDHMNRNKAAVMYGPLVLAADEALVGKANQPGNKADSVAPAIPLNALALASSKISSLKVTPQPAPEGMKSWPGAQVFGAHAVTRKPLKAAKLGTPMPIQLIPFADAGSAGTQYKVWLPLPHPYSGNLLQDLQGRYSRRGDLGGSITDENFETALSTRNDVAVEEDWFMVQLDEPVTIERVVFAHGKTFPDGGWFDASAGKPRIQVTLTNDGPWQTVMEIADYPATTTTDSAGIKDGAPFTCKLASPVKAWAVRVVGKPARGKNPKRAFATCAELQAYAK
jgi:uncharacterized protein